MLVQKKIFQVKIAGFLCLDVSPRFFLTLPRGGNILQAPGDLEPKDIR